MAPIRVGIVGLSSKPDAWATLAHLPRLLTSPNYTIVALCNSSLDSTNAAIKAHNLPSSTKAYSTPADLAADPDVDLFVVSTRVDTHHGLALPALAAGKAIYIEWPLAANLGDAQELASLAQTHHCRTVIGFQGRVSPTIRVIKSLLDTGRLGTVHSVNVQAVTGNWQDNVASSRYHYFADRKVGGNLLTIYGGHILDSLFSCVGELKPGSYTPKTLNLRRRLRILQDDGSLSEKEIEKTTPDQIMLTGLLERGANQPPAALSFHLRAGTKPAGTPGSTWRIYGEKAELVVEWASAGPQIGQASSIKLYDFASSNTTDLMEEVKGIEGGEEWTGLPVQGQNIGRLYEEFAKGDGEGRIYADFDLAVKRHKLIDEFYAGEVSY